MTRNHIDVWHHKALPSGPERVRLRTVLRGSLLPILVWTGVAGAAYVVYDPVATAVLGGVFAAAFLVGFGLRRRAGHSVRCCAYGALGGVLDKSMTGI
ncbi:hypothetical protein AB0M64_08860 [Streptomyces sp. NPDC051771]|uniref:hypothetical protein n=1 Tax=Streptomyces sp. NPDC051771 TaxID=3154847 RepID=UPI00343F27AA